MGSSVCLDYLIEVQRLLEVAKEQAEAIQWMIGQ